MSTLLLFFDYMIPLAFSLIRIYLERSNADAQTMKKFFEFVSAMQRDSSTTSDLRAKYTQQMSRVDAMIKEIEEKEGLKK